MENLEGIFASFDRIAICGGPKAGKSTACESVQRETISTDDYREHPWEDVPYVLIAAAAGKSRFVMEGVQAARALRKGLEVDAVVYLEGSREDLTSHQVGMSKAVAKWFTDWQMANPTVPTFVVHAPAAPVVPSENPGSPMPVSVRKVTR